MVRPALTASLRRLLVVSAALLLPAVALAQAPALQTDLHYPMARLRITPFVGWATGVTREEGWHYSDGTGAAYRDNVDMSLAGGPAAGVLAHLAWRGPFSLLGGLTYVDRGDAEFAINGGENWVFTGSSNVLVKAGMGMELSGTDDLTVRRLGAGVFVAPFYMLELPQEIASIPDSDLFDAAHHFGLNFGVTGELPFAADRLAVQLGFEDYLTMWGEGALQRLPDWFRNGGEANPTEVDAEVSHQWLVRAGLSFRFQ